MLLASVVVLVTAIGSLRSAAATEKPNILFVMTDDQPIKDTMVAMPEVRERVRDMGMTLPNAMSASRYAAPLGPRHFGDSIRTTPTSCAMVLPKAGCKPSAPGAKRTIRWPTG